MGVPEEAKEKKGRGRKLIERNNDRKFPKWGAKWTSRSQKPKEHQTGWA
jgi:hypothetical protein